MVREAAYYRLPLLTMDIADERPPGPMDALELRDSVRSALRGLAAEDRQLLLMVHADGLTPREIGCVLHISEHAAGLRHTALIAKLRQAANNKPK